jgi:hypothetical protein
MLGYKAVRVDDNGNLRFLFHGVNGSTLIEFDKWLYAKKKWVKESSRQTKYRSGFHFLRDLGDVTRFDRLTKGKYVWVLVEAVDPRPKPRSSTGSWLCNNMKFLEIVSMPSSTLGALPDPYWAAVA